jgi:hypothetical protein
MGLDRDLIDAVRDLDEHELRRLLILAQARLEGVGGEVPGTGVRLRRRFVRCGKTACTQCPHGPYWYADWHEDGKRRTRYVGKLLDE